tara:strand:+ start:64 stop:267 length:204 start_codon:yes stop_codon:yes gene_type:complete
MADYTITTNSDRDAALSTLAREHNLTTAQLLQGQVEQQGDVLILSTHNEWWNSLDAAAKKRIYDANQ